MSTFSQLQLSPKIVAALATLGIETPTPVQEEAIAKYWEQTDLIVQAQTGSGKTYAYLCPILEQTDAASAQMQVLILAPTHELVMQIKNTLQELCQNAQSPLKVQPLIGEANINKQIEKLKEKPQVLVGTPGRVLDLFRKKKLNGQTIKTIVLDEADQLLDNTNRQSVLDVIKSTQRDRRLLAYSASFSENSMNTLRDLMKESVQWINVSQAQMINPRITHFYVVCEEREKFEMLRKVIHAVSPKRALIFQHNGARIDLTAEKLTYHKLKAHALYSALDKEERQKAMAEFRKGTVALMVCSDLAARGLDIPEVSHVINLDFPQSPNEYIHRAGRTARGNADGVCISIITPKESAAVRILQREFGVAMTEMVVARGQLVAGRYEKKKAQADANKAGGAQKKKPLPNKDKGAPKRLRQGEASAAKKSPQTRQKPPKSH